jgi:UDP-glucose:(heptosyl)LPS alpha-1,3-glucosyltransferase
MRLAFVKKRFSTHGGAELYLRTMLGALMREGHELHIFANRWTDEQGLAFHKVNIIQATSFLSALTFSWNSARELKKGHFDCVVSFERTEHQDIYRAGDGCHRAWLDIRSGVEPLYRRLSFSINPFHRYTLALEAKIFSDTPLIIVNSEMVKKQIQRYYGAPDEKITVAYNGVDLDVYSPANKSGCGKAMRGKHGIRDEDRALLFVGSGFGRKGVATLIKALPGVVRHIPERVVALIAGKGDSGHYRELAQRVGVSDNVIFTGAQPEIAGYYAAADIFVLPTLYDPFSNACLEAMASGLPVITTRNNGVAEIIEQGREGFVTESLTDPEELSGRIILALRDAEAMGVRARAKAEQFSIRYAAERFIGLIKEAAVHSICID